MGGASRRSAVIGVAVLWICCACPFHNAAFGVDDEELVQFCIAGMKSFRDELQSGEFVGRGRAVSRITDAGTIKERAMSVEIHYEVDGERLRFRRKEGDFSGTLLRSDGRVATYIEGEGAIVKDAPESEVARIFRPFDIRSIGLLSFAEIEGGFSTEELFELLSNRQRTAIDRVEEASGIHVISWIIEVPPSSEMKRTIWINSADGFTPFRMEVRARDKSQDISWADVRIITEVAANWQQYGDVWVPKACQMKDAYGTIEFSMEFDWKSVNIDIPTARFTPASLHIPDGTYIVDRSLGTPIVEEVVGKGTLDGATNRDIDWRILLIGANIIVIVVILVLLIRRRGVTE